MECSNKVRTILLETNDRFDRVRTQADDQDCVREYYMSKVNLVKSVSALEVYVDMLMDMTTMMFDMMKDQLNLTPEQQANFQKLKQYHNLLGAVKLQSNTWELDWLYGMVKTETNAIKKEFIAKRNELSLGVPLPVPNIATSINPDNTEN